MKTKNLKNATDWFRVHSLRDLADPSGQVQRKEVVVSLNQYPHDFGLGPNPREPVLTSSVSKKIKDTLEENWRNFHLLNRGITIVAKHLEFDNKSSRVRLLLNETEEEEKFFGILDGGNTNERINKWRGDLDDEDGQEKLKESFVNIQILIPGVSGTLVPTGEMVDLLNDIKEARNTSTQVKTKSLADAREHFDFLKSVLQVEPYFDHIAWHEGQQGGIDALLIIIFLMIFYPSFSSASGQPSNAYGRKERCLAAYLDYAVSEKKELKKWLVVLPDIIRLFDELQVTLPDHYGGRIGGITQVTIHDKQRYQPGSKKYRIRPIKSQFLGKEMKYAYPLGWVFPIFAAFRVLVGPDKSGERIIWKKDPIAFWKTHGDEICKRYEPHIRDMGYETKKVATNLLCYQATQHAVNDLYKDELLKEAGIEV